VRLVIEGPIVLKDAGDRTVILLRIAAGGLFYFGKKNSTGLAKRSLLRGARCMVLKPAGANCRLQIDRVERGAIATV